MDLPEIPELTAAKRNLTPGAVKRSQGQYMEPNRHHRQQKKKKKDKKRNEAGEAVSGSDVEDAARATRSTQDDAKGQIINIRV